MVTLLLLSMLSAAAAVDVQSAKQLRTAQRQTANQPCGHHLHHKMLNCRLKVTVLLLLLLPMLSPAADDSAAAAGDTAAATMLSPNAANGAAVALLQHCCCKLPPSSVLVHCTGHPCVPAGSALKWTAVQCCLLPPRACISRPPLQHATADSQQATDGQNSSTSFSRDAYTTITMQQYIM
jgi:hypothetical protein